MMQGQWRCIVTGKGPQVRWCTCKGACEGMRTEYEQLTHDKESDLHRRVRSASSLPAQ